MIFEMNYSEDQKNQVNQSQKSRASSQRIQPEASNSVIPNLQVMNSSQISSSQKVKKTGNNLLQRSQKFKMSGIKNYCQSCEAWEQWSHQSEETILQIQKKLIECQKAFQERMMLLQKQLTIKEQILIKKQQQYQELKFKSEGSINKLELIIKRLQQQKSNFNNPYKTNQKPNKQERGQIAHINSFNRLDQNTTIKAERKQKILKNNFSQIKEQSMKNSEGNLNQQKLRDSIKNKTIQIYKTNNINSKGLVSNNIDSLISQTSQFVNSSQDNQPGKISNQSIQDPQFNIYNFNFKRNPNINNIFFENKQQSLNGQQQFSNRIKQSPKSILFQSQIIQDEKRQVDEKINKKNLKEIKDHGTYDQNKQFSQLHNDIQSNCQGIAKNPSILSKNHNKPKAPRKFETETFLKKSNNIINDNLSSNNTLKTIKLTNNYVPIQKTRFNQPNSYYSSYQKNRVSTEFCITDNSRNEYHKLYKFPNDQLTTVISHTQFNDNNRKSNEALKNPQTNCLQIKSKSFDSHKINQILEDIKKLQFENQNLKSYNRVLLQKLSNSRPKKY